ncbi:PLD nuclease N-terminal domain-containing protein [Streptomyces sp. NPDC051940]|uniref:PLD nuclease N-terminal domain-containing protein n=1 Tax=Streptomyces sp. NPDC051940 TaxID=3155675 RepID=UPI0034388FBB
MIRYVPYLLFLALWIYAFIDCLNTPEEEVRHLPKVGWVLIILFFAMLGSIAWLVAGKNRGPVPAGGSTPAEWHRNHRPGPTLAPDDDPEFLASLREENKKDESLLKDWEADLRRREDELRRREGGEDSSGQR